jgi:hypothetical protein
MILGSLGNICVYFVNNLTHCMKRNRLVPISVVKFNNQKWGNFYVNFLKKLVVYFQGNGCQKLG